MRKIVIFNRISIDGFFAGPKGEIDWFIHDPKIDKTAHEIRQADTILFGRVTYQLFESHWTKIATDPNTSKEEQITANELCQMTKVIISKTLKKVTWKNSKLVKVNVIEEVRKLKQGNGHDIIIFGSGTLAQQLTDNRLIDEYVFVVTPVILGAGKALFQDNKKLNLELLKTKDFESGNVMLHYKVRK